MLHTKFRGNRSAGSGKEDFCRIFTIEVNVKIRQILKQEKEKI